MTTFNRLSEKKVLTVRFWTILVTLLRSKIKVMKWKSPSMGPKFGKKKSKQQTRPQPEVNIIDN